MTNLPLVKAFFDEDSSTYSYVVADTMTKICAIIDSVLDYDIASAKTSTTQADKLIAYVKKHDLKVEWILETHVHADHLTAAPYLKQQLGGKIAMSKHIDTVQQTFAKIYHVDITQINANLPFDYLFDNGEAFSIGELHAYNIPTPGHTPACLSYVIGDAVFIGDTLFMPDYGSARCDFPKGSAATLYDSVQKLYELNQNTRVFVCHDYLSDSRQTHQAQSSIAEQKQQNIHLHEGISKADFVTMREQRDSTLDMPKLILPAIQVNMRGGDFPEPEDNGVAYLKIPLNYFN